MATASSPAKDKYRMLSIPRGICVIINNRKFTFDLSHPRSTELKNRYGSEHDVVALARTFTKLQFIIKYYEDQTDTQMASIMKEAADDPAQTNYDIFVCCIMSHGRLGQVYGSNGVPVDIKDLTYLVKPVYCLRLIGKPKLFFIQACQGSARQRGYSAHPTDEGDDTDTDTIPSKEELIPNDSDFLLCYSTVPGNVSWRDRNKGSPYIRHLTDCLDQLAHREDILHLHLEVNDRVAQEGRVRKQTSSMFVTLRKKLFLATQEITDRGTDERPQSGVTMTFDPLKATASSGVTIETNMHEAKEPKIVCIAVSPSFEHLYMTDKKNRAIKVFSRNPDRRLSKLKLDLKPRCVAVVSDSLLAVTSDYRNVLVLIDVSDKLRPRVKSTVKTKRQYKGVGVMTSNSDDTTLVVSCDKDDTGPSSVDVITLTGEVIRNIVTSQTLPDMRLPWYLHVDTQRDVLYISDRSNSDYCVWCVELTTGRVLQTLEHPQMFSPRQVCTDSAGNLYVASFEGQCVLVKSVGDVWRVLLTDQYFERPLGISVTDTGLVVSWSDLSFTAVRKYDLV